jgi:hypothetical protein
MNSIFIIIYFFFKPLEQFLGQTVDCFGHFVRVKNAKHGQNM